MVAWPLPCCTLLLQPCAAASTTVCILPLGAATSPETACVLCSREDRGDKEGSATGCALATHIIVLGQVANDCCKPLATHLLLPAAVLLLWAVAAKKLKHLTVILPLQEGIRVTKALGGDVILSDGTPLPDPPEDFWADEKFEVRRAAFLALFGCSTAGSSLGAQAFLNNLSSCNTPVRRATCVNQATRRDSWLCSSAGRCLFHFLFLRASKGQHWPLHELRCHGVYVAL